MARLAPAALLAAVVLLTPVPAAGARTWRADPVAGTKGAYLNAAVALPGGGRALLVTRTAGRERRLEVIAGGRTRLLARGRHTFSFPVLAADARGTLTAFWEENSERGDRDGYLWERGRVRRVTSGPRSASWAVLDVAPDGSGVVAVGEGGRVLIARRGPGRAFGVLKPSALGSVDDAAAASGGRVALVGSIAGSAAPVIMRAPAADAALTEPRALPAVDPGAGRTAGARQAAVAMTASGRIVASFTTLVFKDIPPSDAEPPVVDTVVQAVVWDPADASPRALPVLASGVMASDVALVAAGARVWAAWSEAPAGSFRPATVAVASLGSPAFATVRRLRAGGGAQLGSLFDRPALGRSGRSGARVTLAATVGSTVTLRTVAVTDAGRFGSLDRIAPGRRVSVPVPVTGSSAPVLGLTLEGARAASSHVAIAHP